MFPEAIDSTDKCGSSVIKYQECCMDEFIFTWGVVVLLGLIVFRVIKCAPNPI
jgi:hypothetical protein